MSDSLIRLLGFLGSAQCEVHVPEAVCCVEGIGALASLKRILSIIRFGHHCFRKIDLSSCQKE